MAVPLSIKDLKVLLPELYPARKKWYDIGLLLDVPVETLDTIQSVNGDDLGACLREMLHFALTSTSPELTWKMITDTLNNVVVGEGQLGDTLVKKYCSDTRSDMNQDTGQPKFSNEDFRKTRREKEPKLLPIAQEQDIKAFMSEVVILLHTVKEEELVAVYEHLKPPDPLELKSTIFYRPDTGIEVTLGVFGNHKAALVRTSKGGDCRQEIGFALKSLPALKLIIAVGFAYGRRDKCKLGDVLVSTTIDGVSNLRVDKSGEIKIDEGDVRHTAMTVKTRNTFTKRNWIDFICSKDGKRESQIHCGVIISSPMLLNNKSALEKLITREQRFIGGEMEGQELAHVTSSKDSEHHDVDFIVIKGVADFGDGTKEKDWQFTASLAAASYAEKRLEETQNRVYFVQHDVNITLLQESPFSKKFKEIALPLRRLPVEDYPEKVTVVKKAMLEFISSSFKGGQTIQEITSQVQKFHTEELLISKDLFKLAQQMIQEEHSKHLSSHVVKTTDQPTMSSVAEPLYSKDTLYHAMICSHAVCERTAGDYQQFFKDKEFVQGHNFKAISMSRSKQYCFLIAQTDESTYYFAFKGQPLLSEWARECNNFNEGIVHQTQKFPTRYIIELLNKRCRVIFTGFSFGGLLASAIAASVWDAPFISSDLLKENMTCITFGQPHVKIEVIQSVADRRPEMVSTFHLIYHEHDHIPSILSLLDECWSAKIQKQQQNEGTVGMQLPLVVAANAPFKDPSTTLLLDGLKDLQQDKADVFVPHHKLKEVLLCYHSTDVKTTCLCSSVSVISCEKQTGLIWKENLHGLINLQQLSHQANTISFAKHLISKYTESIFDAYLDKPPKYVFPESPKCALGDVDGLKPSVSEVHIHHHGKQSAIVLEGNNLWFCYQISFRSHIMTVTAADVSNTAIQFNSTHESNSQKDKEVVALISYFSSKPIKMKPQVNEKRFSTTTRQEQVAKLNPSQVIELAYLCTLLEKDTCNEEITTLSQLFEHIQLFLNSVVKVVPFESIAYAIANGNYQTAVKCCKVLLSGNAPSSLVMMNGLRTAEIRFKFGLPARLLQPGRIMAVQSSSNYKQVCVVEVQEFDSHLQFLSKPQELFDPPSEKGVIVNKKKLRCYETPRNFELADQLSACSVRLSPFYMHAFVSEINIESVYSTVQKSANYLNSPLDILVNGRKKLNDLAARTCKCKSQSSNRDMLVTVNNIRNDELDTCTSLLGGFMDQEMVHIFLGKSNKSDMLKLNAPASVGVWTLFSLDYSQIKPILAKCRGEQMLIKIMDHVKGISGVDPDNDDVEYDPYAAKLQFIAQGMTKTVTCNTKYVSYSLERQLVELCHERNIEAATSLSELNKRWSHFFKDNMLSLVDVGCRPLIARWIKWALMIHDLREELAKYTAVGVVGLVNSGKSKLVSTLFGIQIPTGTTESKRTTVPFLYNLNERVEGLTVVDFPGVDDEDDSIGELADLLLTIAQIVVFVVDYRKAHTQSAKKWLTRLQEENVPVLVCLTFGDKLYAEHMGKKGEHPSKDFMTGMIKEQLSEIHGKLRSTVGSHQTKFFSFCQDNDSVLNTDAGRDKLREVRIGTPQQVGEWLVKTFKKDFDQGELANQLEPFIDKNIEKANSTLI